MSALPEPLHPPRPSHFAGSDIAALAELRWEPGTPRPVFEDDFWSFEGWIDAPAYLRRTEKRLRFDRIHQPLWRIAAKEFLVALLAPTHEQVYMLPHARRRPVNPATCHSTLRNLTLWLNWLSDQGIESLTAVSQDTCDRFIADYREIVDAAGQSIRARNPTTVAQVVNIVKDLAAYAEAYSIPTYGLDFMPWRGSTGRRVAGAPNVFENTTPPVPDKILRPLLSNCLYMVETIGPHLLRLNEQARAERERVKTLPNRLPKKVLLSTVAGLIAQHRQQRRSLPKAEKYVNSRRLSYLGWSADDPLLEVNVVSFAHWAGAKMIPEALVESLRDEFEAAVADVGIEGYFGRDADLVKRADGLTQVPWTLPTTERGVEALVDLMQTVCTTIVVALTGMRRSELFELVHGCRMTTPAATPDLLRYRLQGKVIKGRQLGGEHDEWVVVEPVWNAISIVEGMRQTQPGQLLFANRNDYGSAYQVMRDWMNSEAGQRLGLQHLPDYLVSPRALRRTLSLELAARPGGLLAAKVALKHISVSTTEGYAARPGGAQAVFHTEWKRAEAKENLRLTLEAFHQFQEGHLPTGPGAAGLIEAFQSVETGLAEHEPSAANTIETDRQLELMLKSKAATLHQGTANYCWFTDPSQALCLKLAGATNARKPLTGMCDSSRCPQATHHARHRPVWATAASNTKVLLENPRIKKGEKQRLRAELERSQHVLDQIDSSHPETG